MESPAVISEYNRPPQQGSEPGRPYRFHVFITALGMRERTGMWVAPERGMHVHAADPLLERRQAETGAEHRFAFIKVPRVVVSEQLGWWCPLLAAVLGWWL